MENKTMNNLVEAFEQHAILEKDSVWCREYRDTLSAVDKAASKPGLVSEDIVDRLLFEPRNGICDIWWWHRIRWATHRLWPL
jgi:hypothetical protein